MSRQCKVLLVDDHPVVVYGLRLLLENDPRFAICGEAEDALTSRRLVEKTKPDFMVLDLVLGGRDGTELIKDLLAIQPGLEILVYSSQDEMCYARRSLRAGARGYVSKTAGLEVVKTALETIAEGQIYVSPAVQRSMVNEYARGGAAPGLDFLSDRELQVFRLLGNGRSSASIADELHLGMKTVQTYRERLKNKLGLSTARELDRCAERFIRTGEV